MFITLMEGDHEKVAAGLMILEAVIPMGHIGSRRNPHHSCKLFSKEFMHRHGMHLVGTSTIGFLPDVTFTGKSFNISILSTSPVDTLAA